MDGIYYVIYLVLLQVRLEELCNFLEQVIACVAAIVDAMVAVGVYCHLELLVRLCECVGVAYHVAQVYVVIGCAVDEQQVAAQLVHVNDSRAGIVTLLVLLWSAHVTLGVDGVIETPVCRRCHCNTSLEHCLVLAH